MSARKSQEEVDKLQYHLRSAFFYRKGKEFNRAYKDLISLLGKIDSSEYNWKSRKKLGITRSSLKYIKEHSIDLCRVFCHPDVIISFPALIIYYKSIAVLPQKALQRMTFDIRALEEGKAKTLTEERALLLARILNTYISSHIDADPEFNVENALVIGMMNYGSQLNGSWRNEIGNEGTRRVKEIILKHFLELGKISGSMKKKELYPFTQ